METTNQLNTCQARALELLNGPGNVFLTGVAGSGKSFLIRHFLSQKDPKEFPVLASTGAAAILVGGRTFHSFFGLGILQGGVEATIERALASSRLVKRLRKLQGVVIDEISMLSGSHLRAAEAICRLARQKSIPWGGIRVIAVGDFAQLPPVTAYQQKREWAFLDESWQRSCFEAAVLRTIVRTRDTEFLEVLDQVRNGRASPSVSRFLDSRRADPRSAAKFRGTRLFPRRDVTEAYNLDRLNDIPGEMHEFQTRYSGRDKAIEDLMRSAPIPEVLRLKEGALVMLRQNDPQGRWVNGSLGQVAQVTDDFLKIDLHEGRRIEIDQATFSLLDAEGKEVASATNFPVNLAYATTIHKAQGMTIDQLLVDLRNLWEPGQAYVAMSRVRESSGLAVSDWTPQSIKTDPLVQKFYSGLGVWQPQ